MLNFKLFMQEKRTSLSTRLEKHFWKMDKIWKILTKVSFRIFKDFTGLLTLFKIVWSVPIVRQLYEILDDVRSKPFMREKWTSFIHTNLKNTSEKWIKKLKDSQKSMFWLLFQRRLKLSLISCKVEWVIVVELICCKRSKLVMKLDDTYWDKRTLKDFILV